MLGRRSGSMMLGQPAPAGAPAPVYDPAAQSYFAAMTVQPNATRKGLINDLIVGLKTDGVWAKLDRFGLRASHTAQAGLLDMRTPTKSASAVNSPAFTVDRGFQGDGATSYVTFGEGPGAAGIQISQDNVLIGSWCNLQGNTTNTNHIGQEAGGNPSVRVGARADGASESYNLNTGSSQNYRASSDKRGHRTATRISATAQRAYFNGSLVNTNTFGSNGVSSSPISEHRHGTIYSADRMAASYFGAGLSDAEVAALHNRLNTFLTAIGAN